MPNTLAPHGAVSLDIIAQEIIFALRADLAIYRGLPKKFSEVSLRLGETLNAKVPAPRVAKRKKATAAYENTAVSATETTITLDDEIYDRMELLGTDLHASAIDLRELYAIPSAQAMGEGILSHAEDHLVEGALVGNTTANFNPANFTHTDLFGIDSEMNLAKVAKGGRFIAMSEEYALPLRMERVNNGLNENIDANGTYVNGGLPERIGNFRVHVTNAFSEPRLFAGNSLSLGVVTSVPFVPPAEDAPGVIYRTVNDPETGITLQFRQQWVTEPTEQYNIVCRVYVGHKVPAPETLFYKKAAA